MKFWRPGITGKLFLAIFATCIVLLITMHWAVRISFERGFIDYIKHGNEPVSYTHLTLPTKA